MPPLSNTKVIEQELLFYLNEVGYIAGPYAPLEQEEMYLVVERVNNDTDIRWGYDSTTLAIDCFVSTPEISGGDRWDAYRLARAVAESCENFKNENLWVREITEMRIQDASVDRWLYYTVTVTFFHTI